MLIHEKTLPFKRSVLSVSNLKYVLIINENILILLPLIGGGSSLERSLFILIIGY